MELIGKTHRQLISFDKDIGHLYVPNIKARIIDSEGGYFFRTNSEGFRSDINFKKKKEKLRILFFGDSNTAGDGVSNENRFSEKLGNYLNAEIFNYAVSGTGTDQQLLIAQKYAKEVDADLIFFGVLVENIERNKVEFRETISSFSKKINLTSKPYFKIKNDDLVLENCPVRKFNGHIKSVDKNKVQWAIPKNQTLLYNTVNFFRKTQIFKFLNKKFENELSILRSKIIKTFYQPFKDYKKPNSIGYILLKKIIDKFLEDFNKTPIILMPIPTYHYYVDGAKPIYQNFFKKFDKKFKNVFMIDPLTKINSLNLKEKKTLSLKNDKSHFSIKGHNFLANFIANEIQSKKILKISDTVKFDKIDKKKNKEDYILGISAFYHDSAASIIKNGKIIAAAQEERFTRKKNDQSFPINAINYCLEEASINQSQLKAIIFYDNVYLSLERVFWTLFKTAPHSLDSWSKYIPSWLKYKLFIPQLIRKKLNYDGKILQNLHHRSHLASAFYPSPFEKSAILTIDGVGEWATASIGVGENNQIKMIKEMSYPNSVGLLYSAFTQYLGFSVNSGEYKMMGLAPYGKPIYYETILKELIDLKNDGSIIINQKYFDYMRGKVMTNKKFENLFEGSARKPESKITQREMDIASSIQKVTEKIILNMANYTKELTQSDNLCLSGGVALNCVANGILLRSNLFKNIWIQPASGDAGSSLGCALDAYYSYFKENRDLTNLKHAPQQGSFFGPSWNDQEIKSFLDTEQIKYKKFENLKNRNKYIATNLDNGRVIGLFNGRTEFGPRALGARSIIGDPRNKEMQTTLNLKIKKRESFRPFAPAILSEKKNLYFELENESPYMMLVAPVKKDKRLTVKGHKTENLLEIVKEPKSVIPAVTHVDFSARIQSVDKELNENFYFIIKEFENLTSCPILINTSFNVRGEPIVNSPFDAFRCFVNTNMDILILENFAINKNDLIKSQIENWKIKKSKKNRSTKINFLNKEINKIYKKNVYYNKELNYTPGWIDKHILSDKKKIFEIPQELDFEDFNPEKMAKEIINFWNDKKFGDESLKILIELLILAKKFDINKVSINEEISKEIYEMF